MVFRSSQFITETKFRSGDFVVERTNPSRKMIVKHFINGLYYCYFPETVKRLFVYSEWELKDFPPVTEGERQERRRQTARNSKKS
jgi:hypothetical protein